LDGEAEALTRNANELGLEGDIVALRLCLDRIVPPQKDRHIAFALPVMNEPADAAKGLSAIVSAVASGELTPRPLVSPRRGIASLAIPKPSLIGR
jgi:hypothetical protein